MCAACIKAVCVCTCIYTKFLYSCVYIYIESIHTIFSLQIYRCQYGFCLSHFKNSALVVC